MQKEIAEREKKKNKERRGHLLEATMALLSQMNVSKIFWSDVVLTAAFLINQLPTRVLKGKSPSQVLCPSAPLLFIPWKAFGSVCFFHIPKHQTDKLDAKAINCVFVGNLTTLKGCQYNSFATKNGKQFVSMDVSFFQNIPFYSLEYKEMIEASSQRELTPLLQNVHPLFNWCIC